MKKWQLSLLSVLCGYLSYGQLIVLVGLNEAKVSLLGQYTVVGIISISLSWLVCLSFATLGAIGLIMVLFVEKIPHISIKISRDKVEEEK